MFRIIHVRMIDRIRGRWFFFHYKSVASYHAGRRYIDVRVSLYIHGLCSGWNVEVSKSNQESARSEYPMEHRSRAFTPVSTVLPYFYSRLHEYHFHVS